MYSTQFQQQYHDPRFNRYEPRADPFPEQPKTDQYPDDPNKEYSPIERSLRINFTRKVFGIAAMQIFITGLFVHFLTSHKLFFKILYFIPGTVTLAGFVSLITSLALGFFGSISRNVPLNYILLSIFTAAESYCLGYIAVQFDRDTVVMAMYLTAAVVAALTVYAMRSKTEITYYGGLLVLLALGTGALSFINWFTRFSFFDSLLFFGGCVMSGLYFIYDVKLLMGRDRFSLTLDDYIRGAMHLYIDVVRIFINILQIIAAKEKEKEREKEEERERQQRRYR